MTYLLRLYITGRTEKIVRGIETLRSMCDRELKGEYTLEVIDVLEHPKAAEADHILATPMLIRKLPLPVVRVVGDFWDTEKILADLCATETVAEPPGDEEGSTASTRPGSFTPDHS